MIDTIKLHLHQENIPDNYLSLLNNIIPDFKPYGKEPNTTYLGMFKNLKVVYGHQGLFITNSLATFRFGNNQKTLNLTDIADVISELSDEFQVPFIKSKVNRVDIGENIVTKYKPELYFGILESATKLEKIGMPNGFDLRNTKRSLNFYDKIKEQKKHKNPITRVLTGQNVIRYEYRYRNHQTLAKFLGLPKVLMGDVIENYDKLVDSWYTMFNNIHKSHELLTFKPEVFTQPRAFIKQMQISGIESYGGVEAVYKIIENAKAERLYKHKNDASIHKKWVRDIMKTPNLTEMSDLATELEDKVKCIRFINGDHLQAMLASETGITN